MYWKTSYNYMGGRKERMTVGRKATMRRGILVHWVAGVDGQYLHACMCGVDHPRSLNFLTTRGVSQWRAGLATCLLGNGPGTIKVATRGHARPIR